MKQRILNIEDWKDEQYKLFEPYLHRNTQVVVVKRKKDNKYFAIGEPVNFKSDKTNVTFIILEFHEDFRSVSIQPINQQFKIITIIDRISLAF